MAKTIGIDLGTTTSIMTFISDGEPQIIEDQQEGKIIPSVVGIHEDGSTIIGKRAKNQILQFPDKTVMEVKRLFGTDKIVKLGDKEFQPYEISAILISHLKKIAEKFLNEEVTEAVITVPANFNNIQRKLTKQAGELAGLKVERIINEPTAAAIAYGFNNSKSDERVLVYDLGGGTFDVTILEIIDGVIDVICSRGNNELGGKDFDNVLERYIINDFYRKYDINLLEQGEKRVLSSIKEKVEEAKKDLSSQSSTNIYIPYVSFKENQPLSIDMSITRSEFENMIMELVMSTQKTIDEALQAAHLTPNDIDSVILVGGSSRIPLVKEIVESKFPNKVKADMNPDIAVAIGAGIQAGIKKGQRCETTIIVTDKCSHNLGVSVQKEVNGVVKDGIFSKIIEKDCSIPCTKTKIYTTVSDNQKEVVIPIYEGDSMIVTENIKIGEVVLDGIPDGVAGSEDIIVDFKYDLNGIVNVTATIKSTNKAINTVIDFGNAVKETSKQITEKPDGTITITDRSKSYNYEEYPLYTNVEISINYAQRIANESHNQAIKDRINAIIEKMKDAIVSNDKNKLDQLDIELTDVIFEI